MQHIPSIATIFFCGALSACEMLSAPGKAASGAAKTHLLSCECKTSRRDSSSLGRSSVNGGGWCEWWTEEDWQDRLEDCCVCWSGQQRYIPGTFADAAEWK